MSKAVITRRRGDGDGEGMDAMDGMDMMVLIPHPSSLIPLAGGVR